MANTLTAVGAIKRFFAVSGKRTDMDYKPVNLQELQSLSVEDRAVLGEQAAKELGLTIGRPINE